MESIDLVHSIRHVDVIKCVGRNALVSSMEIAARSTVDARRTARTDFEDAIVLRVNAEADNAHALLLAVNVTQMSAGIAGLAVEMAH